MNCWVGFSFHGNFISRCIAKKLGKPYSHTFFIFPWRGKKLVIHAIGRGVVAVDYDEFVKKNTIIKVVKIEDKIKAKMAFDYAVSRLGTKYGYLAVIAAGLGIHFADGEKSMDCSEFITRALGITFEKELDLVTPAEVEERL